VKLGWISFVFLRVLKSLRELLWTHVLTSGTMAMTLFIFGGFLLVQDNLHTLLKGWGSQIQIFAYLNPSVTSAELQKLTATVRSYPEVESVRFVSREQAWESFKKSMGSQSGLLEGLQAEILPPSLEITLKMPYRERAPAGDVAQRLRGLAGISQVEYPEEWVERLGVLVLGVQWAKWIFGGFLFAATLLIVGNTVKLAILARRDEIEIMQLVGAPEGLIQAPFVVEGMIQGIAGAALSLLLLWLLFLFLGAQLPNFLGIFAVRDQVHFLDVQGVGLMLALGWLLGACGSLFSLRRFLKV
jgi:cell division transport system permease protein